MNTVSNNSSFIPVIIAKIAWCDIPLFCMGILTYSTISFIVHRVQRVTAHLLLISGIKAMLVKLSYTLSMNKHPVSLIEKKNKINRWNFVFV